MSALLRACTPLRHVAQAAIGTRTRAAAAAPCAVLRSPFASQQTSLLLRAPHSCAFLGRGAPSSPARGIMASASREKAEHMGAIYASDVVAADKEAKAERELR